MIHVVINQTNTGEPHRGATRLHPAQVVVFTKLFDHVRVIRGISIRSSVRAAFPLAIIGVVPSRRYYPLLPTQLIEADVERLLTTLIPQIRGAFHRTSPDSLRSRRIRFYNQEWPRRIRLLIRLFIEDVDLPIAATATIYEQSQLIFSRCGRPI